VVTATVLELRAAPVGTLSVHGVSTRAVCAPSSEARLSRVARWPPRTAYPLSHADLTQPLRLTQPLPAPAFLGDKLQPTQRMADV
jgi:hypothetical protein